MKELVLEKYNKFRKLLIGLEVKNPLVQECINTQEMEFSFSFWDSILASNKMNIVQIYNRRAKLEETRKDDPFVVGYDSLLPILNSTDVNTINISSVKSDSGSFIIFSDMNYTTFIGILKSKMTLTEIRNKMKGSGTYSEYTFRNGELSIYNERA